MQDRWRIGFAGTDGRTLLSAQVVSTARSQTCSGEYTGVVVRGTPSMPEMAERMGWPVEFVATEDNSVASYAEAVAQALDSGRLDCVVPMPEALLFNGLVDELESRGHGERVAGLRQDAAFIEGDKIACKELCDRGNVPVADHWTVVDAKSAAEVRRACLDFIHTSGGAVLKYPYSAGGKGARVVLDAWEIGQVYDGLMRDYKKEYKRRFKSKSWPLLVESRMSGMEISFTILVDAAGSYRILPTAMDYPERFAGAAGKDNPITGGMGSISPHPFEDERLIELVEGQIASPLVRIMKAEGLLRPCVLYPGCFVSFSESGGRLWPRAVRVCEVNIRPGEPEFQPVARRLCNLGPLVRAMFEGRLDQVEPEVRQDQISLCAGLVTGPGGPDGQKGYPWSVTKHEPLEIDFSYLGKKNLQLIPSGMGFDPETGFYSDGTRVAYLNINGTVKPEQSRGEVAEKLRSRILSCFSGGKVRVVPREDPQGNRLAMREDIGLHFSLAEELLGHS
jgi:phosphoribosylamine--glycine ligase